MRDIIDNYGRMAGKIWKNLSAYGPQDEKNLIKKCKINNKDFYAAVGWLARENKICKIGLKYKLGETNLTDDIGNNAGKVWNALNRLKDTDVLTIADISKIKLNDAYSALGWLAREDKIEALSGKQLRFKLK